MNPNGRPRLPEEAKNKMVYARLNPSEMVVLDKLCRKLFLTRSGVLRKALYDIAEKELGMRMSQLERPVYMDSYLEEEKFIAESNKKMAEVKPLRPLYLDEDDV